MSPTTLSRSTHSRPPRPAGLLAMGLGAVLVLGACAPGAVSDAAARGPYAAGEGARGNADGSGGGGRNGNGGGSGGYGNGGGAGPVDLEDQDSDHGALGSRVEELPIATLTDEEIDALVWMREEEKVAHDVYVALGETWGGRIFENIARSETNHYEAVGVLLDRYGIADPAAGLAAGEFDDPRIQALYDELVAQGRSSLSEAFAVGALIEELDIQDLRERATDTADVALVFESLEQGSQNHLRAFLRNLDRLGAAYAPTHLSIDEFEAIVGSLGQQDQPA